MMTNRQQLYSLLGIATLAGIYGLTLAFALNSSQAREHSCGSPHNRIVLPGTVWQKIPDQNAYRVYWNTWIEVPHERVVAGNHTSSAVMYYHVDSFGNPYISCFLPPKE